MLSVQIMIVIITVVVVPVNISSACYRANWVSVTCATDDVGGDSDNCCASL